MLALLRGVRAAAADAAIVPALAVKEVVATAAQQRVGRVSVQGVGA